MKRIKFDCHGNNAPAYSCSESGDWSGDYYRAEDIDNLKDNRAATDDQLLHVTAALVECHDAFRRREHGSLAEHKLLHDLERILNMPYDARKD